MCDAKIRPPWRILPDNFITRAFFKNLKDVLVIKLSGKMYEGGLIFAPYIASILKIMLIMIIACFRAQASSLSFMMLNA